MTCSGLLSKRAQSRRSFSYLFVFFSLPDSTVPAVHILYLLICIPFLFHIYYIPSIDFLHF